MLNKMLVYLGSPKSIKHLRDMVRHVAMTDVNVFIRGEAGVRSHRKFHS